MDVPTPPGMLFSHLLLWPLQEEGIYRQLSPGGWLSVPWGGWCHLHGQDSLGPSAT